MPPKSSKKTNIPVAQGDASAPESPIGIIEADLSLDMGNAMTNMEGDHGSENEDFRSILAPLSDANRLDNLPVESVFKYNGTTWVMGDACYTLAPDAIEENVTEERYLTEWYKTLFAAALHRQYYKLAAERTIIKPRIISSIPAMLFKGKVVAEKVQKHLAGTYTVGNIYGGEICVEAIPSRLKIVPEGIGTYWSYLFSDNKAEAEIYSNGTWMFCDFGYLSLDMNIVRDGNFLADDADSDTHVGMSLVANAVQAHILAETGKTLLPADIDHEIKCNSRDVNGRPIIIRGVRDQTLSSIGRRASVSIAKRSRGKNFRGVVITGGGAEYIPPYLDIKQLPPYIVASGYRRRNVIGGYRYIKSLHPKS